MKAAEMVNRCAYCGCAIHLDGAYAWRHTSSGLRSCNPGVLGGRVAAPRAHAPFDPRPGVPPCAGNGLRSAVTPRGGTLAGRGGELPGPAAPPWLRDVIQWRVVRKHKPELAAAMLAVIELGERVAVAL